MQMLSVKLGVATGLNLAQHCRCLPAFLPLIFLKGSRDTLGDLRQHVSSPAEQMLASRFSLFGHLQHNRGMLSCMWIWAG